MYGIKNIYNETKLYRKEGNILFNDALNTLFFGYMASDMGHSDSETGIPLPPHGLLFPINNMGSFICTIPQTE